MLYNESELRDEVDNVVARLEGRGLSLHYFRRDVPPGAPFKELESQRLRGARAVVVVLGDRGWGPSQLELVEEARGLGKPLLPVLIGKPPEQAFDEAGGLFRDLFYVDLQNDMDAGIGSIAQAIKDQPSMASRPGLDLSILTLIDGSDAERAALLEHMDEDLADSAGLAARLRDLIRSEFGPEQEGRFEKGMRDSSRFASIRSWMLSALIKLDPDHPDSRDLLLQHIDPSFDKERAVRFWCLAGLVRRRPAYLEEALNLAIEDRSPEVADLARAAHDSSEPNFLDKLRRDLASDEFATAWHVLRILRVIPITELVSDVCAQLGRRADDTPLTYDALFALANPVMATAARDMLLERPGLDRLAAFILEESRRANLIAVRSFAHLLTVFERPLARRALETAARSPEDRQIVETILRYMAELDRPDSAELFIPGYSSDTIDVGKDDIGIKRDVETLAAVMLAREFQPPLAIGLFGAWGSGKSFFMHSIQAVAERMAKRARDRKGSRFCSNIVQINFNAWHYNDANLWASLVSHILDQLSAHVSPVTSLAQQQTLLEAQLDGTKATMAAAEADQRQARLTLDQAEQKLETLRVERARDEVRLRDLRAEDFAALLAEEPALKEELTAALKSLGASAPVESVQDLERVIEESRSTGGRAAIWLAGVLEGVNAGTVVVCILLLLAAPVAIGMIVHQIGGERLAYLSAIAAEAAAAIGAAAAILRKGLGYARTGLETLSAAKRKVDALLAARRAQPTAQEQALEQQIAQARAGEQAAAERLAAASAQAADIEHRVAALKESQTLGYFLAERTSSDDYRRHLGLISVIRKDFETLVQRLQAPPQGAAGRVERIVLYIDDLDRCPSSMVVEVLQAVHLLLAYPLFVVVVSVDPRWLLRSLEVRFRHFRHGAAGMTDSWAATPQDYLEKIFQIPFSVRPMGERGFARLVGRLLAASDGSNDEVVQTAEQTKEDAPDTGAAGEGSDRPNPIGTEGTADIVAGAETKTEAATAAAATDVTESTGPRQENFEILEEALVIQKVESDYAKRLHAFIPTPRSAKRFANIYRLLKAPLGRDQLQRHEGTHQLPGDFRLPMLLLAMLVGYPDEAAYLFPQFLAQARGGRRQFWLAAEADLKDNAEVSRLREEIGKIASETDFPNAPHLVADWLPRIARFSFVTARMAAEE